MGKKHKLKLVLRRETVRRLARGELTGVAGGWINGRCTHEVSNCGHTASIPCTTQGCPLE